MSLCSPELKLGLIDRSCCWSRLCLQACFKAALATLWHFLALCGTLWHVSSLQLAKYGFKNQSNLNESAGLNQSPPQIDLKFNPSAGLIWNYGPDGVSFDDHGGQSPVFILIRSNFGPISVQFRFNFGLTMAGWDGSERALAGFTQLGG